MSENKILHRYEFKGKAPLTAYGRKFHPGQECHVEPGTDFEIWLKGQQSFAGPFLALPGGETQVAEAERSAELDRKRREAREQELLSARAKAEQEAVSAKLAQEQSEQAAKAREIELQQQIALLQTQIEQRKQVADAPAAPAEESSKRRRRATQQP